LTLSQKVGTAHKVIDLTFATILQLSSIIGLPMMRIILFSMYKKEPAQT